MGLSAGLSSFQITEGIYCLTRKHFSLKKMSCSAVSGNSSVPWMCMQEMHELNMVLVFSFSHLYWPCFSLCAAKSKCRNPNASWWGILVNILHLVCLSYHRSTKKWWLIHSLRKFWVIYMFSSIPKPDNRSQ